MYKIENKADSTEILLYDDIGYGGISARDVVYQLKANPSNDITLRINSLGGDVFEALAMYNFMKGLSGTKTVYIDGSACSAASLIAMCGDKIIMPENALMMIHNPWGYCQGDSEDMKKTAEVLDKTRESCVMIYAERTGLTREKILSMIEQETWMNGNEALALGFCDEVSGTVKNSVKDAYDSGVRAERERLKELDRLMNEDRREIIMKAKYETYQSAKDIAIELLEQERPMKKRIEDRRYDAQEVGGVSAMSPAKDEIEAGVRIMNKMRGY